MLPQWVIIFTYLWFVLRNSGTLLTKILYERVFVVQGCGLTERKRNPLDKFLLNAIGC